MTMQEAKPVVKTALGKVQGTWQDGVAAFRGIPFAAPPIGPLRFASPAPAHRWQGIRSAEHQATALPQSRARGESAMGPMDVPGYDEGSLTLNVWTSSPNTTDQLPVLVWFHGGGFLFGSGSASWYDGSVMARRGRIVVVSVNYRLGALGWLYFPAETLGTKAIANRGLQDQCQALEWVRDNIIAFGGDPDKVTVAGQSAGGLSIVALHATPRASGLFRRAIVQSAGPGVPANSVEEGALITQIFCDAAGVTGRGLLDLSVDDILKAQNQTLLHVGREAGYDPLLNPPLAMIFQCVVDGEVLPIDPVEAAWKGSMDQSDLMITCASEEMRFATAFDETWWQRDRSAVVEQLKAAWKGESVSLFERYAALDPHGSPPEILSRVITDKTCVVPSIKLAERRAAIGKPAYFAWFTWWSPAAKGRLGPCHSIELPFVFNNIDEYWSKAPMVAGSDPAELQALANNVQDAWIAFVTNGNPGKMWPAYTQPDKWAMEFGSSVGVIHDPAEDRRALWERNPDREQTA